MPETKLPEPWLRGTLTEVSAVQRAVMHALVLAQEGLEVWCSAFTDAELNARPAGLAPLRFIFVISRGVSTVCSLTRKAVG